MNGKRAKQLRRMAREECAGDPSMSQERELVIAQFRGHDRIINDPYTVHNLSKCLKKAYNKSIRGQAATQQPDGQKGQ